MKKMNFLLFNRKYGMMHRILQQRENIFQTRMNELGAIPSSFTRHIILDLSKFLGFHHIFFSTFACIDKMSYVDGAPYLKVNVMLYGTCLVCTFCCQLVSRCSEYHCGIRVQTVACLWLQLE